ncbi:hypothetical protein FIBSPDRAFT_887864 [Athelia psychrophila]|uniref:Uncharacterized protein n=1 Tax=Athelia psychrophila TaxID=1759441 RepID=A0A166P1I1_9AGAM|nr:hypothetical protein FIBSPDRAFT_887864 [Fibularhizoctonia sp. CBS 109695]
MYHYAVMHFGGNRGFHSSHESRGPTDSRKSNSINSSVVKQQTAADEMQADILKIHSSETLLQKQMCPDVPVLSSASIFLFTYRLVDSGWLLNDLQCAGYGPRGGDAALPRLHRHYKSVSQSKYRHSCKYRDGAVVWVDGWGKVVLRESGQRLPGFRCFACISRTGRDMGRIKIPEGATIEGGGRGPRDWSALFAPSFD